MKRIILPLIILSTALLVQGCKSARNSVIAATGTLIGVELAQNPASQMYQAKLGYGRSEVAIVPTGKTDTGGTAKDSADVLMELRYGSVFSLTEASIYQRLAVGSTAVTQPGATLMFAKSKYGTLDATTIDAITRNVQAIPAPDPGVSKTLLRQSQGYKKSLDKTAFDTVAAQLGHGTFSKYLLNPSLTADQANQMDTALKAANLPTQ